MAGGIRAEVRIATPGDCPIAALSATSPTPISTVATAPVGDDRIVEEFVVDDGTELTGAGDMESVYEGDGDRVVRFERERGVGCACECVQVSDGPVADVTARDGDLYLTLYVEGTDAFRAVYDRLATRYPSVDILRLFRESGDAADRDLVTVDRAKLTPRQREVMETAHELGYFAHPKGANATEVAAALDITRSTFAEHLAAAHRKLHADIFDAAG